MNAHHGNQAACFPASLCLHGNCFVLGDFSEDLRTWGFALHWILSGSGDNAINWYLNISYLENSKNNVRLKLSLIKKQQ